MSRVEKSMQKKYINITVILLICSLILMRILDYKVMGDIISGCLLIFIFAIGAGKLREHFGKVITIMLPPIILFIISLGMEYFNAPEFVKEITLVLILLSLGGSIFYAFCSTRTNFKSWKELYMKTYKDIDDDSSVSAYEYGNDYIKVQFASGAVYTYSYQSAGASNIEKMKKLADNGEGLNAFINKHVRNLHV